MKNYHWTMESWGADYPPENAWELIDQANELIDAYAAENGYSEDDDSVKNYAEWLWEIYCRTGSLEDAK